MSATGKWRGGIAAAAVFAAFLAVSAPAVANEIDRFQSLAGRLLVAAPEMEDPRFRQTVIYVCVHDPEGALGLVINRGMGTVASQVLADEFGVAMPDSDMPVRLRWGGPVEAGRAFILHSAEYARGHTVAVTEHIALSGDPETFADLLDGRGPERAILALGYAGWRGRQLEGELAEQAWFTVDAGADFVFGQDMGNMWRAALALRTIEL